MEAEPRGWFREQPGWTRELLETARVARLAMLDDAGCPRVLPVTFALAGDAVWSAVDEKPKRDPGRELARVRWLRARPQAALLVDRYSDDWDELAWVQVLGRVAVVGDQPPPEELIAKYEPYRRRPPPGPLLRLDVERVVRWRAADR
jgi:PPOX class probable F420-dependent enzyme